MVYLHHRTSLAFTYILDKILLQLLPSLPLLLTFPSKILNFFRVLDNFNGYILIDIAIFETWENSNGSRREIGITEGSGDIQQEFMLHVPCNQEIVLRSRGEPGDIWARWGRSRQGNGVGAGAARVQPFSPSRVYWG